MIIIKSDGKVDEELLTREEALPFAAFLQQERERHMEDIVAIDNTITKLINKWEINTMEIQVEKRK